MQDRTSPKINYLFLGPSSTFPEIVIKTQITFVCLHFLQPDKQTDRRWLSHNFLPWRKLMIKKKNNKKLLPSMQCDIPYHERAAVARIDSWTRLSKVGSSLRDQDWTASTKMATSLGSNTYNRQNWEDAVRFIIHICAVCNRKWCPRCNSNYNVEITSSVFTICIFCHMPCLASLWSS